MGRRSSRGFSLKFLLYFLHKCDKIKLHLCHFLEKGFGEQGRHESLGAGCGVQTTSHRGVQGGGHAPSAVSALAGSERRQIRELHLQRRGNLLRGILSRYVLEGRIKGKVWNEAVQEQIFYLVLEKMKEIIEFWDKPMDIRNIMS